MTEEEAFHQSRRMFVVTSRCMLYAPLGDTRSHEEWFATYPGGSNWMQMYVRGFFDKRGVFLYQQTEGSKWDVTLKVITSAPYVAWSMYTFRDYLKFDIPDGHQLYGGMLPDIPGMLWSPKCNLGIKIGDVKTWDPEFRKST